MDRFGPAFSAVRQVCGIVTHSLGRNTETLCVFGSHFVHLMTLVRGFNLLGGTILSMFQKRYVSGMAC